MATIIHKGCSKCSNVPQPGKVLHKNCKGPGKWQVLVRKKGHPTVSETLNAYKSALERGKIIEDGIKLGTSHSTSGKISFKDLVRLYIKDFVTKQKYATESTMITDLGFWSEYLGAYSVNRIDQDMIEDAANKLRLARGIQPPTVRGYLAVLSKFFKWAVNKKYTSYNPVSRMDKSEYKESEARVRYLSDEERERLFKVCREISYGGSKAKPLYAMVISACYSGCRAGELLSLFWEMHPDKDTDSYVQFADTKKGSVSRFYVGTSKNKGKRIVKMLPLVESALREWRSKQSRISGRVFGLLQFPQGDWKRALKEAGIRNFVFHDLRHTCASYLAMSGATLKEIKEILGHKTLTVTDKYVHLTAGHLHGKLDNMGSQFGGN